METSLVSSQLANVANAALNVCVCVGVARETEQVKMQWGKMEAAHRHKKKHKHAQRNESICRMRLL